MWIFLGTYMHTREWVTRPGKESYFTHCFLQLSPFVFLLMPVLCVSRLVDSVWSPIPISETSLELEPILNGLLLWEVSISVITDFSLFLFVSPVSNYVLCLWTFEVHLSKIRKTRRTHFHLNNQNLTFDKYTLFMIVTNSWTIHTVRHGWIWTSIRRNRIKNTHFKYYLF